MDKVKLFRELSRELEIHFGNLNQSDCCACGVNESQCFLVVEIGRQPGICVKDLACKLKLDKSGISRSVEELVQKGYVSREPSKEDRRCVLLTLTDAGKERFDKIEKDMYIKFEKVFRNIEEDKKEQVLDALKVYNEAMKKAEGKCCDKSNACE